MNNDKIDILIKIRQLETMGYFFNKNYTIDNSLFELQYAYEIKMNQVKKYYLNDKIKNLKFLISMINDKINNCFYVKLIVQDLNSNKELLENIKDIDNELYNKLIQIKK
jgi:hypothetical protein